MIWMLALALVLIVALYARTITYFNCIDDGVEMKDTLYSVPTSTPPPRFFLTVSPIKKRLWAIGVHMLNTCLVYLLIGGPACLLFAVYPINANNVAWLTGSYYSTATFLTLAAYYFIIHVPWYFSVPLSMACFGAALNATIVTISFPFVFLFANPLGLCTLIPLAFFLKGKRFTTGIAIREAFTKPANMAPDVFTLGRVVTCIKVMGHYLYLSLVPLNLCFFHTLGDRFLWDKKQREELMSVNWKFFASVAGIGVLLFAGFYVHKMFWALWFLVLISAFSQYRILGQFFCERYMYPATIGIVALLGCLPSQLYWALFGAYVLKTYLFIPAFANNCALYENGTAAEPLSPANFCNLSDWYLLAEPDLSLAGCYAQRAIKLDPTDFKPHVNMSSLFKFLGQWNHALTESKTALIKAEGNTSPLFIGMIQDQIKKIEEKIDEAASKQQANAL